MTERGKKIRDAFYKKYGVYHPSQLPEVKEKIKQKRESGAYDNVVNKMKKTKLEKYGDENFNNLEKGKKTKLEKYGDENFNNREKMVHTNIEKYGMNVSPNTLKKTKERSLSGEIGFKSSKYKQYLSVNGVENVSQLTSVKDIKRKKNISRMIDDIFCGSRLNGIVVPMFTKEEYTGCEYNKMYKFKCCVCQSDFEDNLYSGNIPRCLTCHPHNRFNSSIEIEILEFLRSCNVETKQHDRTILDGNEIDIFLPSLNLAIECDGVYWHSEIAGGKDKKYHIEKTNKCNAKGIQLIHIWDWEWRCKSPIIKSILLNKIGKSSRIYARNCTVKEITSNDKSAFLSNNHIQGDDISSVRIGLYYDDDLVSVMTFVKSRYDKKYQYELSRFCNKLNVNIIGGASKMFTYFVNTYNATSIVTYSDKRLFNGKVYESIGMSFVENTVPGYHYFHKNKCVPINRINFQKHKLKSILPLFNENMTEWENMQINGYDRIWDCGHFKYEWFK